MTLVVTRCAQVYLHIDRIYEVWRCSQVHPETQVMGSSVPKGTLGSSLTPDIYSSWMERYAIERWPQNFFT